MLIIYKFYIKIFVSVKCLFKIIFTITVRYMKNISTIYSYYNFCYQTSDYLNMFFWMINTSYKS